MIHHVDVAIVGGGLVGAAAALALCKNGLQVAVVDQANLQQILNASYDGRTLAIAYGSKLILEKWGIWQHIAEQAQPIQQIRVSTSRPGSFMHYDAEQVADHPMGYIIEIRHLRAALLTELQAINNCHLLAPAIFKQLEQNIHTVSLQLESGEIVESKLAIGADGRQSAVREALGIKSWTWSYDQTAIVFVAKHTQPHQGVAYEHFMSQGPLAFLPMHGNRSSVVWTLPTEIATAFMALDEHHFNEELQRRFGSALGAVAVEGKRWSYPLNGLYCRKWYQGRVALMGDACHAIHPVAGQGFNLGLRDAEVLVEKIVQAYKTQQDIGASSLLQSYQRERRIDSISMTAMTDGLVRLFSNDLLTLGFLRATGLRLTNKVGPLKKILTRHAMGIRERRTGIKG